jgi:hypothetical protein
MFFIYIKVYVFQKTSRINCMWSNSVIICLIFCYIIWRYHNTNLYIITVATNDIDLVEYNLKKKCTFYEKVIYVFPSKIMFMDQ